MFVNILTSRKLKSWDAPTKFGNVVSIIYKKREAIKRGGGKRWRDKEEKNKWPRASVCLLYSTVGSHLIMYSLIETVAEVHSL